MIGKTYILHLVESKPRLKNITTEMEWSCLGNYSIWWTCLRPISDVIGPTLPALKSEWYDDVNNSTCKHVYGRVFNCALEIYTIVKTSLLRGFSTILLMEDDIEFYRNLDLVKSSFRDFPKKWDIIKLYNNDDIFGKHIYEDSRTQKVQEFHKVDKFSISTRCMILNRKAMLAYVASMEKNFTAADRVDLEKYKLDIYEPKYRVLKKPKESIIENKKITEHAYIR